jgi:hypothetical protein
MPIRDRLITALLDTQITSATAYHTIAYLGLHADETGAIVPDDNGQLASDPNVIAEALGVSRAAVFKSFIKLEAAGYIMWDRARRGDERAKGITGRVRLVLPNNAQA